MTTRWKPSAFRDTYHQDLMKRIHEKVKKGQTHEITAPDANEAPVPRSAQVIDLAALLQDSLRGAKPRTGAAQTGTAKIRKLKPAPKARAAAAKTVARRKRA
jgi:DNA end-binding protein Ku